MNRARSLRPLSLLSHALMVLALALAPLVMLALPGVAQAVPSARVSVIQRGDFLLVGNVLGQECERSVPAPVVGTVGACGSTLDDSGIDLFWRSDSPAAGQAEAQTSITAANARSTAVLQIPTGAEVTHAYLYWSAALPNAGSATDTTATFDRPGTFAQNLTALTSYRSGRFYQSVADVTELVQSYGSGAYRVSGVDARPPVNIDDDNLYSAWWMVILYSLDSAPVRQLTVFEGLDLVDVGVSQSATLSGFVVPTGPFDAKLAVVSFEGDASITGDQFSFDGENLSNSLNPADNFFNGSRSSLNVADTNVGDLPQLTGNPGSNTGADFDVIDVTSLLTAGQSSAPIAATTTEDLYLLAGFVTSVSTVAPDYTGSTKAASDVNGGIVLPGDSVEYTITAINRGNDASIETVLTDPLPPEVTYVPGSLEIVSGPNAGSLTDATGDDQGEYNAGTRTITVRLGVGANAATGGTVGVGERTTVRFRVTINAGVTTQIANQGFINARGLSGSGPNTWPTDGEPLVPGTQQTVLNRDAVLIAQTDGATTVAEGGATDTYSVALATVPTDPVDVTITPANAQIDLGSGPGTAITLNFAADSGALTGQTVTVTAVDDAVVEGNHSSLITHTSASADTGYNGPATRVTVDGLVRATVPVNILDNDGGTISYSIGASPTSVNEGNSGAQPVTFTITRSGDTATLASTVDYSFTGSATTIIDYNNIGGTSGATGPTGTVSFAAGQTSLTITVDVLGDTLVEDAETVTVELSNPAITPPAVGTAQITTGAATSTIVDDDAGRTATVASGVSPAEPATPGNFTVTLSTAAPAGGLTVGYTVSGTATPGVDYQTLSGTLVVPAGQTSAPIPVTPIDDLIFDLGETVVVTLTSGAGYSVGVPGSASLIIVENDQRTATIVAGDSPAEPSTNGSFIVNFNGPAPYAGMVLGYTVSGTATPGEDYEALTGEIQVPSRATSVTIPVTIINDNIADDGETIIVTLARRNNYAIGSPSSATLIIEDEETQRTATIVAGDSPAEPSTNGSFVVSFNVPAPFAGMTLAYTVGGTATPGEDYEALTGEIQVPSRATSVTIPVTIINDNTADPDETIIVTLARRPGYAIGTPNSATLTIEDEEIQRTATIAAGAAPAEPSTNGSFVVSFNIPAPFAGMTLAYTVGGTATPGEDYEALTGEIQVPSRATSVTIPVTIINDNLSDEDETIIVTLARRPGYAVGSPSSATLIIGDEEPPQRTATIAAGETPAEPGTNGSFVVSFNIPAPYAGMTLAYTVGGTATPGEDYEALSGEIQVPSRATSVTIPVTIINDNLSDADETIVVTLARRLGYAIGTPNSATLTIGDEEPPQRTATIVAGAAPAEPGTAGSFVVSFNIPAPFAGMTLGYTVRGTATPGEDYEALSGEIQVPSRATSVTIPVTVLDDTAFDPGETIVVTLGRRPGYAVGAPNSATLTIGENDQRTATIAAGDTPAEPGTAGSFVVSFNGPAPYAGMTLAYTVGGTATPGVDYAALSGEIQVPSRATSVTIPVTILDDAAYDPGETIVLTLGRRLGYAIGTPNSATLTIGENDQRTATIRAVTNPAEPTTNGSFLVEFNGPAPYAGMVLGFVVSGTATPGADYQALTGEIQVPSRATSVVIPISIIDDAAFDPNESIIITLGRRPGYAVSGTNRAFVIIGDNDVAAVDETSLEGPR